MKLNSAKNLLEICRTRKISISEYMIEREIEYTQKSKDDIIQQMKHSYNIMEHACHTPITDSKPSMGGLIGGEAKKLQEREKEHGTICGPVLFKAIQYSMAVLEVNASMGLIVAAPTAGASGVVPGVLISLKEEFSLLDEQMIAALFTASSVGYLAMRNATVSGAVGGCQAEVGVASAMAAAAAVSIMGGTDEQALDAAAMALMNLLGMVCDPIGGLVECPCQTRNAMGASNALTCAQISLAGIKQLVPLDEILTTMLKVGRSLPRELRETALGGTAVTESAKKLTCDQCPSKS